MSDVAHSYDAIARARATPRRRGARTPLADPAWAYVEKPSLEAMTAADWALLDSQRPAFEAEYPARTALQMLAVQKDTPSFGYQVNNYEHCLQAATLALRDGQDEETIVCALFHDLGFVSNLDNHGELAAELLRPYASERNVWMLRRHMYFQNIHCAARPGCDADLRERWRGHAFFEYTARWVAKYDQASSIADFESAPLAAFEPMVQRLFTGPRRAVPLPE